MSDSKSIYSSLIVDTPVELERLYVACEQYSQEAFNISDISRSILTRTAKLTAVFRDAFRFVTTWDYSRPEVLNVRSLARVLKSHQYTDVADIVVYKPVGFHGNLLEYVNELQQVQLPTLASIRESVLQHARRELSAYIDDPDSLNENRAMTLVTPGFSLAKLEELKRTEAKWVIAGNRSTEATYGELFQNHNECSEALTKLNTVNASRWKTANPKQVSDELMSTTAIVGRLLESLNQEGVGVSDQVRKVIAEQVELIARWIEWYSVMVTRIIDLTAAMKLTEKKLLRGL